MDEPTTEAKVAENLLGKLARYPAPAYRKAYLAGLVAGGARLHDAGNPRAAAYCFAKVGEALKDIGESDATSASNASTSDTALGATSGARPAHPAAESSLELLRHHWRRDRFLDAEAVLRRQGGRLSALENRLYRERLLALKGKAAASDDRPPSVKVDAALLDLRRQLYGRVLKSLQVSWRRRSRPNEGQASPFLLPGAPSTHASSLSNPAAALDHPETAAKATGLPTIVGPYNDRYNLGDLLTLLAQADAAWVEEFLDLYRGLADLKGLVTVLPPQARK